VGERPKSSCERRRNSEADRYIRTASFVYSESNGVLLFWLDVRLPYPRTATFLIEHRHEIVRPLGAQVQIGGSGTGVPDGLRAVLLWTPKTRHLNLRRVGSYFLSVIWGGLTYSIRSMCTTTNSFS
jgi:hypothetical protein